MSQYASPERLPILTGYTLATEAGAGITAGAGTVYRSSVLQTGGITVTRIVVDITGLLSSATGADIIGADGAANCHLGLITTLVNGTILGGTMTCVEAPLTGDPDIDLFLATVGTGVEDTAVTSLADEAAVVTSAASWTNGRVLPIIAYPASGSYLYLAVGNTGVAGTYTAGRFVIELIGTV